MLKAWYPLLSIILPSSMSLVSLRHFSPPGFGFNSWDSYEKCWLAHVRSILNVTLSSQQWQTTVKYRQTNKSLLQTDALSGHANFHSFQWFHGSCSLTITCSVVGLKSPLLSWMPPAQCQCYQKHPKYTTCPQQSSVSLSSLRNAQQLWHTNTVATWNLC